MRITWYVFMSKYMWTHSLKAFVFIIYILNKWWAGNIEHILCRWPISFCAFKTMQQGVNFNMLNDRYKCTCTLHIHLEDIHVRARYYISYMHFYEIIFEVSPINATHFFLGRKSSYWSQNSNNLHPMIVIYKALDHSFTLKCFCPRIFPQ